jgi:hypothetical protein
MIRRLDEFSDPFVSTSPMMAAVDDVARCADEPVQRLIRLGFTQCNGKNFSDCIFDFVVIEMCGDVAIHIAEMFRECNLNPTITHTRILL